jgi:hypothetical protein
VRATSTRSTSRISILLEAAPTLSQYSSGDVRSNGVEGRSTRRFREKIHARGSIESGCRKQDCHSPDNDACHPEPRQMARDLTIDATGTQSHQRTQLFFARSFTPLRMTARRMNEQNIIRCRANLPQKLDVWSPVFRRLGFGRCVRPHKCGTPNLAKQIVLAQRNSLVSINVRGSIVT